VSTNRDEFRAARRLLKEQVERYGVTRVHALYFKGILSIGTLKNVIAANLQGRSSETKDAIVGFYKSVQAENDREAEKRLYHVLKSVFGAGDQSGAQNYVGKYVCYRIQTGTENSDSPNLFAGRIVIEHVAADDSYRFRHVSTDSSLEVEKNAQMVHTGPIFVLVNRVYLVGLGQDIYGAYMRPIIFQTSATPKTVPLKGMVLTESAADNVPVAARTVLFHDDLHAHMKAENTEVEFKKRVLDDYLRAAAWNPSLKVGHAVNATNLLGW
jgi:ribosomal protein L35AE/L33A